MTATQVAPGTVSLGNTLDPVLTLAHDAWMAEGDRLLGPVTDPNATFWERWTAVRYTEDLFRPRLELEQELVSQLHAFFTPELNARLTMQLERLERLYRDLYDLAHRQNTAREMAHTARELLEALRLWYAEIEFAAGKIRRADLSAATTQLLDELRVGAPAEPCCPV